MNAIEQYFAVVLSTMLRKMSLNFQPLDEIVKYEHL